VAVLLRGRCLLTHPPSPYAAQEGCVPVGRLVDDAGGPPLRNPDERGPIGRSRITQALGGIRSIEVTHNQAGAACAQILAFLGCFRAPDAAAVHRLRDHGGVFAW